MFTHLLTDTKVCRVCKWEKALDEYHPNKTCKQGVVGTCRECTRKRTTEWYRDNRAERQLAANTRNQKRKREIVDHFGDKCLDCKLTYPQYVYQFHHLDPNEKDVNPSYALNKRPTEMWKELNKCVMLCANCHMIRHHGKEGVNAVFN